MTRSNRAIQRSLWEHARRRAVEADLPFNIVPSELIVPEFCPILGIELKRYDGPMEDGSPTVDRIVPAKGYVHGNVVVISNRANRLKSDATVDELRRLASFYAQLVQ